MSELIKALINIKDPFTFLAFISVVLLLALRTKTVPELLFGLLKEKLTKERFAQLLHRFLIYGLVVFFLLCGLAVLGQILAYKAQAQPADLVEVKAEILSLKVDEAKGQEAIKSYQDGLVLIGQQKFDDAIKSLEESLKKIPTQSARYTLAYLYEKQGDTKRAKEYAEQVAATARERGDSFNQVKAEQLSARITLPEPLTLIGDKQRLLGGGSSREQAVRIAPGRYIGQDEWKEGAQKFFKIALKANQTLTVKFRLPDSDPKRTDVYIHNRDGIMVKNAWHYRSSEGDTAEYKAPEDGDYYISLSGGVFGTVFVISIQYP